MPLVVYKLGGSLLDTPELPQRLLSILSSRPQHAPLLIVGGGPAADLVRGWDQVQHLGEERAHWLALKSLQLTAALVAELLPDGCLVHNRDEFDAAQRAGAIPLLCVYSFLKADEQALPPRLPHTWGITSDSIAARVAWRWQAEELVLLKSLDLPAACTPSDAVQLGLVDTFFPKAAVNLPQVSWANLRQPIPQIQKWL